MGSSSFDAGKEATHTHTKEAATTRKTCVTISLEKEESEIVRV
jgi:hypothetical protein